MSNLDNLSIAAGTVNGVEDMLDHVFAVKIVRDYLDSEEIYTVRKDCETSTAIFCSSNIPKDVKTDIKAFLDATGCEHKVGSKIINICQR